MATYCISDVHGRLDELMELLDAIALGDSDELYVLGDIIDRGPKSAEALIWAVNDAPGNIHFLAGNHEDMALDVVARNPSWLQMSRGSSPWPRNGGTATVRHVKKLTDTAWRMHRLLPWLRALPTHALVDVGGRGFLLVHAGVRPELVGIDDMGEAMRRRFGHKTERLGGGFGEQAREDLLWIREEFFSSPMRMPCDVVHGHTEFSAGDIADLRFYFPGDFQGGVGRICHYAGNRHDIDCGGAAGRAPYSLGCLRLDDMEEFYVPFRG